MHSPYPTAEKLSPLPKKTDRAMALPRFIQYTSLNRTKRHTWRVKWKDAANKMTNSGHKNSWSHIRKYSRPTAHMYAVQWRLKDCIPETICIPNNPETTLSNKCDKHSHICVILWLTNLNYNLHLSSIFQVQTPLPCSQKTQSIYLP
jgi:hypothetical protein